jgi:hypothetical protein
MKDQSTRRSVLPNMCRNGSGILCLLPSCWVTYKLKAIALKIYILFNLSSSLSLSLSLATGKKPTPFEVIVKIIFVNFQLMN